MAEKDCMENAWGTQYVFADLEGTRSGRESGSTDDFKRVVSECVPGYQLQGNYEHGTAANYNAVTLATQGLMGRALFGIGCYGGGGGPMQLTSTSKFV